jgi:hypothetical protein
MLWQMGYKYARCTELYRVTSIWRPWWTLTFSYCSVSSFPG